jgi:hypothetical protein
LAADPVAVFGINWEANLVNPASARYWQCRLGALQFRGPAAHFFSPESDSKQVGRLVIAWPKSNENMVCAANGQSGRFALEWELLRIGAQSVIPVTVDLPWGDRDERPLPLIIRKRENGKRAVVGNKSTPDRPDFILNVRESISPDRDRWMCVDIIEQSRADGMDRDVFTMLSLQPWSVTRFSRRPLEQLGDEGTTFVATFDSDQRVWQYRIMAPEYRFQYPPQGIGESADKPSLLELHDLNAPERQCTDVLPVSDPCVPVSDPSKIDVMRPAPRNGTGNPRRSYVVECRLTPSLDLWVRPSDLERNYFMAETSARELFRQRNDFGIGMALKGIRGEFLYGLAVGVQPSKEDLPESLSRVAEIEALLGRLPPNLFVTPPSTGGDDVAKKLLERWKILRRVLLGRHERIEIWTPSYHLDRPFAPSRFSKGVSFGLRTNALHRLPVRTDEEFNEAGVPPLRIDPNHGLSGGAIWPIESLAFLKSLRERPDSNGGTIERIAIGPGGGDADQNARFLDDRLAIASQTRNGFVKRQRVEIYGRIGVFWNRARHVVVYERTVNPSEQFAPLADKDGWHRSRSRRAVIRKVSEYVEILENPRSYPDQPSAADQPSPAVECGFLDSMRFNTRIIHVDSAWSEEISVPEDKVAGYVIPLWNAGAAVQRPNVYPLPNVSVVTVAAGKEPRPLGPRQIANPENLYFYSQSSGDEGDPDKWPPVFGVDYGNLIDPAELEREFAPGGDGHGPPGFGSGPGRKPSTPRTLPGHQRFTWRLLPDGVDTALNAGVGDKPVYGNLESITFSRGGTIPTGKATEDQKADLALSVTSSRLGESAAVLARNVALMREPNGEPKPKAQIENLITEFKIRKDKWQARIDELKLPGKLEDILGNDPLSCDSLKKRILEAWERKRMLFAQCLQDAQGIVRKEAENDWNVLVQSAWNKVKKDAEKEPIPVNPRVMAERTVDKLLELDQLLSGVFDDMQSGIDSIVGEVAKARLIVRSAFADVESILVRISRRIEAAFSACSQTAKWTANRYLDLRGQIQAELDGVTSELNTVVAEASQRIGMELGPFGAVVASKARAAISKEIAGLVMKLKLSLPENLPDDREVKDEVAGYVRDVLEKIREQQRNAAVLEQTVRSELDGVAVQMDGKLDSVNQNLRKISSDVLRQEVFARQIISRVGEQFLDDLATACEQGGVELAKTAEELRKYILDGLDRLVNSLTDLKSHFDDSLMDLLSEFKEKVCDPMRDFLKDNLGLLSYLTAPAVDDLKKNLKQIEELYNGLETVLEKPEQLKNKIGELHSAVSDTWASSVSGAQAYAGRVSQAVTQLGKGGVTAAPGNVLRLLSAATAAPEIGQLQANMDRLRCSYQGLKLETSKATAALSKLGDALKAMGIEVPFDGLSDRLAIPEGVLKDFRFDRLFPSFGGLNLKSLFEDVGIPEGVRDAVTIRHEFDKARFRASVEVDVRVPVAGRKKLFGLGPFVIYFRDTRLTGFVRAEASKDEEVVSTTERGEISTNIEMEIAGSLMVSLESTRIRFSPGKGLDFDFNPRGIRLNPALQFVKDTLGSLIADEIGGMKVLKDNGIPIGLEHQFNLPNISLMAGASGIANIQLGNTFRLVAYPDFVLSNRFNISRPELPFIFAFFIIGGTGYIVMESRYRPFDRQLSVDVETALGGAASLAIALGPLQGGVFFSLSIAIRYQKTFGPQGSEGDGLSISVLLVIAGNLTLFGFIDVYIGVMLRMTYQENGAIDATGTISIRVKICWFLTISFRAEASFRLKDGQKTTSITSRTEVEDGERITQMREKAKELAGARS